MRRLGQRKPWSRARIVRIIARVLSVVIILLVVIILGTGPGVGCLGSAVCPGHLVLRPDGGRGGINDILGLAHKLTININLDNLVLVRGLVNNGLFIIFQVFLDYLDLLLKILVDTSRLLIKTLLLGDNLTYGLLDIFLSF